MALLVIFEWVVFDLDYFEQQFIENDTVAITGLSMEQLMRVSGETLDYLKGDRSDLIFFETINGETVQVFKGREIEHMVDVRYLFDKGFLIRNISASLSFLGALLLLIFKDKRGLFKAIQVGSMMFMLVGLGIAVYGYYDFNAAFIIFHEILFTNDLWLLDPKTDIMIQMLPLRFFIGMALRIGVGYVTYLLMSIIIATRILKKCFTKQNNLV
jgi:integral membrane protein (TIGR01906 family)